MKHFPWHGMFSRLESLFRPTHSFRRARFTRSQLNIEMLEGRLVPAAVAPGALWDDGYYDAQGQKIGVTVSLKNEGSSWLEVGGGGGAVSVAPGSPPPASGGSYSSMTMESFPDGGTGSPSPTSPTFPFYAFSVVGMVGEGSGDVSWSGAAESLSIVASGDISSLSISGDLYVRANYTIGDLSGRTISAKAGQSIGNVYSSDDVGELSALTTIGRVSASDGIGVVIAGASVGAVSAGGNITSISAGTNTNTVEAGGWLGSVSAGLDIGGAVRAGLWIGGAYLPDAGPDDTLAWQYATYGGGVSAGRDVVGSVSASRGIVGVNAGRDVLGAISAGGGDIWWVTAGGGGVQGPTSNPDPSLMTESGGFTAYAPGNISGVVQAARDIHAVAATGDIRGNVSAQGGFVHGVNAGGQITGNISAGSDVGGFQFRSLDTAWHPFDPWLHFNGSLDGGNLPRGAGVSAGDGISGNVSAASGIVGSVNSGGPISGAITAGTDIGSVSSRDGISGKLTAGRDVGGVSSLGGITGDIDAGQDIGMVSAGYGWFSPDPASDGLGAGAGTSASVSGLISASRDIGYLQATAGLSGATVAGRDIGSMEIGSGQSGGSISAAVSAGRNIGQVSVGGTGGQVMVPAIEAPDPSLVMVDNATGGRTTVRPATPAFSGSGEISAPISAGGDLGAVTAFGAISAGLSSGGSMGQVWAAGEISGAVISGGEATVMAWGIISGDIAAKDGISVACMGTFSGSAASSSGGVRVGAWGQIAGRVTGALGVTVTALSGINGASIQSQTGEADVTTWEGDIDSDISAGESVNALARSGGLSGQLRSRTANVSATSFRDAWATINANVGYAMVLCYGNYTGSLNAAYDAIVAVRGNYSGNIVAGGATTVYAAGLVTARIEAGLNDIDLAAGGFQGVAVAGTNLDIRSWGDVSASLTAKGDIKAFVVGNLDGSVLSDLGEAIFLEVTGDLSASVDAGLADVSARVYGSLKGNISTGIGSVTGTIDGDMVGNVAAFKSVSLTTWGDATGSISTETGGGRIELTADGKVTGTIASAGSVSVLARGDVSGPVSAGGTSGPNDARVESHGKINTQVTATGKITIGAYDTISGSFTSENGDLTVSVLGNATGTFTGGAGVSLTAQAVAGAISSKAGDVTVSANESATVTVTAGTGSVTLAAGTTARAQITAGAAVTLTANESVLAGSSVEAGSGAAMVSAGESIDATVTGFDVDVSAGTTANLPMVFGAGNVTVSALETATVEVGLAGTDFTLLAREAKGSFSAGGNFSGQIDSFNGSVAAGRNANLLATGSFKGAFSGIGTVSLTTLGGNVDATVSGGDVSVEASGSILGTVGATGPVFARAGDRVEAPITAGTGSAIVIALGGDVVGSVTAGQDATVSAAGSVLGDVNARVGAADVWALADVSGAVQAMGDAHVTAWGAVRRIVNSDTGFATVFGHTGVEMAVSSGLDASVSTGTSGAISGAVTAGRDATVWAKDGINGPVVACRDLNATSMESIGGSLSAGNAATVWAMGTINGAITAGSATVGAWGIINGAVAAAKAATVWAHGDVNGSVFSGTNAQIGTWGTLTGDVTAGQSASVLAAGSIIRNVSSGGSVDLTTWGNLSGNIIAGGGASLWVRGEVEGSIQAGTDLVATLIGAVSTGTLSAGHDATVFSSGTLGSAGSVVSAGHDATIESIGHVRGGINAGSKATISVVGDLYGNITSGDLLSVESTGGVAGHLTAGTDATVIALGAFTGILTASANASIWAHDRVNGAVAAGGTATVTTWGNWSGSVTAALDAGVFSGGTASAMLKAGGAVSIALANGGMLDATAGSDLAITSGGQARLTTKAGRDLIVAVKGDAHAFHGAADRDALVLAWGDFYGSVSAGQDATVAFTGTDHWPTAISAGRDAIAWSGGGFIGSPGEGARSFLLEAGRDAFLQSWGDATDVQVAAGNDALIWARGDVSGDATAATGSAYVVSYGNSVEAHVVAGLDVSVGSLGSLTVDTTAGRDLDLFAAGQMLETHAAPGAVTVRGYTGTDTAADWVASQRALADAALAGDSAGMGALGLALERWLGELGLDREATVVEVALARAEGARGAAEASSLLTVEEQGLLEARAQTLADKQEVLAGLATALADIAQAHAEAGAAMAQAGVEVELGREAGRMEIAAAHQAAATALATSLAAASDELTRLLADMTLAMAADLNGASVAKATELRDAQGRLDILAVTNAESYWNSTVQTKIDETLDYVEMVLGVAGLVPGLGTASSAAGLIISLWRGNYGSAALDAVGLIPLVGSLANEIKLTKLGKAALDRFNQAAQSVHWAASVAAKGGKGWLNTLARQTGSPLAKALFDAYEFVFCKALKLACFRAGTPIKTENGPRAIETIQPGDLVWCRDDRDPSAPLQLKPVGQVFERWARVLEVRLPGDVSIGTTEEHPFWVVGKGWVQAGDLEPGDHLLGEDGREVAVGNIVATGLVEKVYNLRVADNQTYFVGGDGWGFDVWVHNAKCIPTPNGYILEISGNAKWSVLQWKAALQKVAAINEAGKEGLLKVVKDIVRMGGQKEFRLQNQGARGRHADHIIDLQLGGKDILSNIRYLDASVNTSMGASIKAAMAGLKDGTRIIGVRFV